MPVMDGYEATVKLKQMMKSGEIPKIPIIGLSANDMNEFKKKKPEQRMDDMFMKPVDQETINKIIETFVID